MFADVSFTTEGIVVISALGAVLIAVIGILWRRSEADNGALIKELRNQVDSWKSVSKGANVTASAAIDLIPADRIVRAAPVPPVVAESSSPPTESQKATAELATERALLEANKLTLGILPEPEKAGTTPETHQAGRPTA